MPSSAVKQLSYAAMERTSLNLKRSKQSSESLTWENMLMLFARQSMATFRYLLARSTKQGVLYVAFGGNFDWYFRQDN